MTPEPHNPASAPDIAPRLAMIVSVRSRSRASYATASSGLVANGGNGNRNGIVHEAAPPRLPRFSTSAMRSNFRTTSG